jgi:hypothetical protein
MTTETNAARLVAQKLTLGQFTADGVISALWRKGFDTWTISRIMGAIRYPEHFVAKRVAELRDGGAL